eukprot:scaffold633_cov288-Ochromonas_danica.AAC.63
MRSLPLAATHKSSGSSNLSDCAPLRPLVEVVAVVAEPPLVRRHSQSRRRRSTSRCPSSSRRTCDKTTSTRLAEKHLTSSPLAATQRIA